MKKTTVTAFISIAIIFCMIAGFAAIPVAADERHPEHFIAASEPNHWGRSDLRSYLNGTKKISNTLPFDTTKNDRIEEGYYESQFSDDEYRIVLPYTYSNNSINGANKITGTYATTDKFWIPSTNAGTNAILFWGGDDISSGASVSLVDPKRVIPIAYWANPLDQARGNWVRGGLVIGNDARNFEIIDIIDITE